MAFRTLLNKIANTGIDQNTSFELRNKLRVFNNANMVIFGIDIFYVSIGILQHYHIAVAVTCYSLLSSVVSYILVKNKKYDLAFHYTLFYGFIFLTAFSLLFGTANNSYYYFLFIPVACNILFDSLKISIIYVLISTVLMTANIYYVENFQPYYLLEKWMNYFSYPNILFASALIFLGVRLFKQENQKYARQIEEQKKSLEEKNREITDSINYAKKIQSALIPSEEEFNAFFKDSFVLFKPKDIVSGDFYWITKKENNLFYVTGDCTGHGVPGGFMTMLGISFLEEIINEKNITEPAQILDTLRERIVHALKQTGTSGESKDGMDLVICRLSEGNSRLTYAAANNSLYILRNSEFTEYKPDKQPCGFYHELKPFTQHTVSLNPGDCIYTFTDGLADQFGGPKGKKYKYKQLENLIVAVNQKPFKQQKEEIQFSFESWKGNLEQIDDVCVMGVKI